MQLRIRVDTHGEQFLIESAGTRIERLGVLDLHGIDHMQWPIGTLQQGCPDYINAPGALG